MLAKLKFLLISIFTLWYEVKIKYVCADKTIIAAWDPKQNTFLNDT